MPNRPHSRPSPDPPPLPPFRLLFQEPRDPAPGMCSMMEARTFKELEEATAMRNDRARKPVQIVDANHQVLWDEYEHISR